MNTVTNASEQNSLAARSFINQSLKPSNQSSLLLGVIEGLIDGILIISEKREWIHANERAQQICRQLNSQNSSIKTIPEEIWRVCEYLITSRSLYPNRSVIIATEVMVGESVTLRIRVRWLQLEQFEQPCLLVTLEDRSQSIQNMAIAEVQKYNLTPREAEVWLLYRANYSYKEIANELYITLNTVKKHMKNIHAKRKYSLDIEAA